MRNNLIRIAVLLLAIVNSLLTIGQNQDILRRIINKIDSLQSFSCECIYRYQNAKDSVLYSYPHYYKNIKDTIVGYSFVETYKNRNSKTIYDGKNRIFFYDNYFEQQNIQQAILTLSSMWCTPISVSNIMKLCLLDDKHNYSFNRDKNDDYQFTLTYPHYISDGYILDQTLMPGGQPTKIKIIIDKQTFLPKTSTKEYLDPSLGNVSLKSFFINYKTIEYKPINAADSIPSNFQLLNSNEIKNSLINKLASNFILKDLSGDTLELYKIKDKYILLDFSTLYCGKCHVALSYLIKQKDSLMSMPLDIIIIDCDKKSDKVKLSKYITENKIPYPILLDGLKVSLKYKAFSNPTFVLIDKDKVIIDMMIGFKEESFKRMIEKINK